jgi:hypothetical protein
MSHMVRNMRHIASSLDPGPRFCHSGGRPSPQDRAMIRRGNAMNGTRLPRAARPFGLAAVLAAALACAPPLVVPFAGPAQAQAPSSPEFERARAAFEALPEAERKAIQDALVWTGDYPGTLDGEFGRRTFEAILAFERRARLGADGTLEPQERQALLAAGARARGAVRFEPISDLASGIRIAIPKRVLVKATKRGTGTRYASDNGRTTLDTAAPPANVELAGLFETLSTSSPQRRVTYRLLRPDFLVVSGEAGGQRFYQRFAVTAQGLRGFTFSWPAASPDLDRVAVAIANSFEPAPGAGGIAGVGGASGVGGTPGPQPPAEPQRPAGPALVANALRLPDGRWLVPAAQVVSCPAAHVAGRPVPRAVPGAEGLALFPAAGPGGPVSVRAGPLAEGEAVVVIGFAPDHPAPSLGVAAGIVRLVAGGPRIEAPLQVGAAGSLVIDRAGALAGVIGPLPRGPRMVAGVVPQATYPLIAVPALAAAGLTGGEASASGPALAAGAIAAIWKASVAPVTCGP